jgi:diguanylate cyclase (GGDEF)-like protein
VDERELIEIENRLEHYPPTARNDILRLTQALRSLAVAAKPAAAPQASSHLYDALTGLLNGGAYGVRFAMARARATRFRKIFAVMSIDVAIGATGGAGDAVSEEERDLTIKHVAGRLESSVRATDTLARIGNENFAVILEDLTHSGHAERVKQIVQDALAEPLVISGRKVTPEISVGIEFYPSVHQGSEGAPVYN